MAVQFLPIIKAVAPYLAKVATAAIPVFTAKTESIKSDPILARQISELQTAATQNANSIQVLVEKMQQAIEGIEGEAQKARKQLFAYKAMLFVSLGFSAAALAICIYLIAR